MRIAYCASCQSYIVDMKLGVEDPVVCASCSESIGRNNVFPCDSLGKTIFAAVKVGGTVTLKDPKYLISIMSDVAPSLSRDIRVFSKALNSSCTDLLIQAINSKDSEAELLTRKIKAILIDEEGLSDSWAEKICDGIVTANLYLNDVAPEKIEKMKPKEVYVSNDFKENSIADRSRSGVYQNRPASQPKAIERLGKTVDTANNSNSNITALLDSGFEKLDEKNWTAADTYFAIVLRNDPNNVDAYLGLAMGEGHCQSKSDFEREYTRPESLLPNSKYIAKIRQLGNSGMQIWLNKLDATRNKGSHSVPRPKETIPQDNILINSNTDKNHSLETDPARKTGDKRITKTIVKIALSLAFVFVAIALVPYVIKNVQQNRENSIRNIQTSLPGTTFTTTYYERLGTFLTRTVPHYITLEFNNNGTLDYYLSKKYQEKGELYGSFTYTVNKDFDGYKIIIPEEKITVHTFKLEVDSNYGPRSISSIPDEGKEWTQ